MISKTAVKDIRDKDEILNYVKDHSRYGDINSYLTNILGDRFSEYRRRWDAVSALKEEADFPLFLIFENMYRCNLRCVMCIHSDKEKDKYGYKGRISFDAFKKIIKEAFGHDCPSITFGGYCEPTLDERLVSMIDFARKNGIIDIMLNTNATTLTPAFSRKIIESGLTRLRIGFDAASAASYEKIRVGAKFERVRDNIIAFMRVRDKLKAKLPLVRISCVHMSKNEREIEKFVQFWKPIADYVSIQAYRPIKIDRKGLEMKPAAGIRKSSGGNVICNYPFILLFIRGNGDVCACCSSATYLFKVGNYFDASLYDIWNSKIMKELRNLLKRGDADKIAACRECLKVCI